MDTGNSIIGNDVNKARVPGASDAATGHHYEAVFPKGVYALPCPPSREGALISLCLARIEPLRAEEHLPPTTGRDRPPRHDVAAPDTARGVGSMLHRCYRPSEAALTENVDNDDVTPATDPFSGRGTGAGASVGVDYNQPRVGDVVVDTDPYAEPAHAGDTLTGTSHLPPSFLSRIC